MFSMTKLFTALTGLFFLAACAGENTTTQSTVATWQDTYRLTQANVSMAQDVRIQNIPQLSPEKKAELKRVFPGQMVAVLNANAIPTFKGAIPAKLDVVIHGISVPTGTGRAFGGSAILTTTARLLDPKSGKVLQTQTINTEQKTFRGSGLFLPVMLAVNSGTTEEQRYQELSAKYVENLLAARAVQN